MTLDTFTALILFVSAINAANDSTVLPARFFNNLQSGKHQTVVTYGTSLTEIGAWVSLLGGWFEQRYQGKVTIINAAKCGRNSEWGLANVKKVINHRPDMVFIEFGINDANTRAHIKPQQALANLDGIITSIRAENPQVDIVLMTISDAIDAPGQKPNGSNRPNLSEYYAQYSACAKSNKIPLIDIYPEWHALFQRDPAKYFSYAPDGLHPNEVGTKVIIWPCIERFLNASDNGNKTRMRD